ncbi:hypothetical protein K3495_g16756, partial [Podosphaera aphanis]
MYTDASKYGTGCVILQYHDVKGVSTAKPTLYDSTTFNKTQRNYGTYKRELLAIVTYAKKYSYMFAGKRGKVMTDHKPLTKFLDSPYVEGIYARWQADLSVLNLDIEYIQGTRNVIADALSRTIFPNPECEPDDVLLDHGNMEECQNGVTDWVWKDGVGGYAEFIEKQKEREIRESPSDVLGAALFVQGDVTLANLVWMSMERKMVMEAGSVSASASSYSSDPWYSEIFDYISY